MTPMGILVGENTAHEYGITREEQDEWSLRSNLRAVEAIDAGHFADALGVPAASLSRALSEVTGKGTKELVTDRVMLEAARLLGFTDMSVNEVAFATGFDDQLYFSRAFKRHHGEAPQAYRARVQGKSMHR